MISIIIPTYNEKENIAPLIKSIIQVCNSNKIEYEIIIIDDASPDGTGLYIQKIYTQNPRIRCYIRNNERGLGTAILYGVFHAKGDVIVGMDADFNHPPELIPKLIYNLSKSDLVIASRFIPGGSMQNVFRYVGTLCFNLILRFILGFPSTDNMSGYYAIIKSKLIALNLKRIYYGYGDYHLRLVWYARQNKYKISEVPVRYGLRSFGRSKSNLISMFFSYLVSALFLRLKNDK